MTNLNNEYKKALSWFMGWIIIAALVLLSLTSCKSTEWVYVPEWHTKYIAQHDTLKETEYVHDSTVIRMKGDTVFQDRWRTQYRDRYRTVYRDSIIRDSVVSVVKEKVSKKDKLRIKYFDLLLGVASVLMILLIVISKYKLPK